MLKNYSNNSQLSYTYNTAGLMSAVNRTIAGSTSLIASLSSYSPINQVGQVVFASGASTTYSYDTAALYRLTRILTLGAATTSIDTVNVLLVGGGGGGGGSTSTEWPGGGGGAGDFVANASVAVGAQTYTVTVNDELY